MRVSLIAFTERGGALADRASAELESLGWRTDAARGWGEGKRELRAWTAEAFAGSDALVFVGAAGICVRAVAPHVVSKLTDPAVLVLSEDGRFVIPLLSGHVGGANALARTLADRLGAVCVTTTATDTRHLFAVDVWAKSQGLTILNPGRIKRVSGKLLAGGTVRLYSDWPVAGKAPRGVEPVPEGPCDVRVTAGTGDAGEALILVPRALALGVGTRRGVAAEAVEKTVRAALAESGYRMEAVSGVFSIDLKKDEPGLHAFCAGRRLPFETFPAEALNALPGTFSGSDFVKTTTGTDCVCERSAVLGARGGPLRVRKYAADGVTAAAAEQAVSLQFGEETAWED